MSKIINDKYYTPITLANYCWDKVYEVIGDNISEIIEPSVGNGSFLHHTDRCPHFGYDIDPQCESSISTKIIKTDFLSLEEDYLEGRLFIGNPPFGEHMNMAQKFFKKAVKMGDYVAFILPISQLNNTHSLYEFDLIYSEDLGVTTYSDRELHCCFNIYKRPENGELNKPQKTRLKDISIYRQDSKGYEDREYDLRMCYWGDATAGKILKEGESYSAEYKIKINNEELKEQILNVLKSFDWKSYLNCIAMRKIQQFHIVDVLLKNIEGIK